MKPEQLIKKLEKIYKLVDQEDILGEFNEKKNKFTDDSQISMIEIKNPELFKLIGRHFWETYNDSSTPSPRIDFTAKASYPLEIFKDMVNSLSGSHFTLSTRTNSPLLIEDKEIAFFLAPRIDADTDFEKETDKHGKGISVWIFEKEGFYSVATSEPEMINMKIALKVNPRQ